MFIDQRVFACHPSISVNLDFWKFSSLATS